MGWGVAFGAQVAPQEAATATPLAENAAAAERPQTLQRAAEILRLEFRNSRKQSCYLVGVINPEAELYSFQRDIGRAGGDEVQYVALFLFRHYGADRDFAS
jgi:hypothetical protein